MNKLLFFIFFIFSIPSIGNALAKCGSKLDNCIGLRTFKGGHLYYGEWVDKQLNGWGTLIWYDGEKYVGNWLVSKRHGWGEMTYKNGDTYKGEWVDNDFSGWGVFTSEDGTMQEGVWKKGKFLYAKKIDSNTLTKSLKFAGRKIVESADDTNFPNLKEYISRPSIGFSNLHPAIKFILEKANSPYSSPLAIEEATKCSFKARYRDFNSIRKIKVDFNKINWKTWTSNFAKGGEFTFLCKQNCLFEFDEFNNFKWFASQQISFFFRDFGNLSGRAIKVLSDLSKVCNRGTSQY